jgi:hypothetical protein
LRIDNSFEYEFASWGVYLAETPEESIEDVAYSLECSVKSVNLFLWPSVFDVLAIDLNNA